MELHNIKPDFDKMSKAELRAYLVSHPSDREAFYKFVDRFATDSENRVWHPIPKTPEDFAKIPELIQEQIEKLKSES